MFVLGNDEVDPSVLAVFSVSVRLVVVVLRLETTSHAQPDDPAFALDRDNTLVVNEPIYPRDKLRPVPALGRFPVSQDICC